MIELKDVGKVYHASDGDNRALDHVNLTIEDGDVFGIIGESGAGKSTLVRHLNLLERPTEGQVLIDGVDITGYQRFQGDVMLAAVVLCIVLVQVFQSLGDWLARIIDRRR